MPPKRPLPVRYLRSEANATASLVMMKCGSRSACVASRTSCLRAMFPRINQFTGRGMRSSWARTMRILRWLTRKKASNTSPKIGMAPTAA
jgi:hypothetical protein